MFESEFLQTKWKNENFLDTQKKKREKSYKQYIGFDMNLSTFFFEEKSSNAILKIAIPCAELNGRRNKYFAMAIFIKRQRFKLKMFRDRWKKFDVAKLAWKIFDS